MIQTIITAIQQELIGEGGLTRVGVRDDRERATRLDLICEAGQARFPFRAIAPVSRGSPAEKYGEAEGRANNSLL